MIYWPVNLLFHLLHIGVILFSMFAWLSPTLRPWHLLCQGGILVSWLGYGWWDGRWGNCAITDLHWLCKERFAGRPSSNSYVQYWLHDKWHLNVDRQTADRIAFSIYGATTLLSLTLWLLD